MSFSDNVALLHISYTVHIIYFGCYQNTIVATACWSKETAYHFSTKGKKQTSTHKDTPPPGFHYPPSFQLCVLIIDLILCFLSVRSPHLDVSRGDALGAWLFDCWVTFPSSICGGSSESAVLRASFFFSCLLFILFTATTSSYWLKNRPEQPCCGGFFLSSIYTIMTIFFFFFLLWYMLQKEV